MGENSTIVRSITVPGVRFAQVALCQKGALAQASGGLSSEKVPKRRFDAQRGSQSDRTEARSGARASGAFAVRQSLERVNSAIRGTQDLEQMMSKVLETTLAILNCDRACLVSPATTTWRALHRLLAGEPLGHKASGA